MNSRRLLTLYLTEIVRWQYQNGNHPFFCRVAEVLQSRRWEVAVRLNSLEERAQSRNRSGYALFFEDNPFYENSLTARRSYLDPFWQVEKSAERWEWAVAKAVFDPESVNGNRAAQFARFWRNRRGLAPEEPRGFLYVPLQGHLQNQRSFQSASSMKMLRETAARAGGKRVVTTLHPREVYSDGELRSLAGLCDKTGIELSEKPMEDLLPHCDGVVTQNSSVAVLGFLLEKPAVVFSQIDFHHIAGSVPRDGLDTAFAALDAKPDFARYLFWFFQMQALNIWRPEFPERLIERLQSHGWDV